jgi:hypothetical protein
VAASPIPAPNRIPRALYRRVVGSWVFWRVDPKAYYSAVDKLASHKANNRGLKPMRMFRRGCDNPSSSRLV